MPTDCPLCGEDMQDDPWPVELSDASLVDGCHDCFEKQADEMWWAIMQAGEGE